MIYWVWSVYPLFCWLVIEYFAMTLIQCYNHIAVLWYKGLEQRVSIVLLTFVLSVELWRRQEVYWLTVVLIVTVAYCAFSCLVLLYWPRTIICILPCLSISQCVIWWRRVPLEPTPVSTCHTLFMSHTSFLALTHSSTSPILLEVHVKTNPNCNISLYITLGQW